MLCYIQGQSRIDIQIKQLTHEVPELKCVYRQPLERGLFVFYLNTPHPREAIIQNQHEALHVYMHIDICRASPRIIFPSTYIFMKTMPPRTEISATSTAYVPHNSVTARILHVYLNVSIRSLVCCWLGVKKQWWNVWYI